MTPSRGREFWGDLGGSPWQSGGLCCKHFIFISFSMFYWPSSGRRSHDQNYWKAINIEAWKFRIYSRGHNEAHIAYIFYGSCHNVDWSNIQTKGYWQIIYWKRIWCPTEPKSAWHHRGYSNAAKRLAWDRESTAMMTSVHCYFLLFWRIPGGGSS